MSHGQHGHETPDLKQIEPILGCSGDLVSRLSSWP